MWARKNIRLNLWFQQLIWNSTCLSGYDSLRSFYYLTCYLTKSSMIETLKKITHYFTISKLNASKPAFASSSGLKLPMIMDVLSFNLTKKSCSVVSSEPTV